MPGVTTAYQNGVHGSRPAANAGCILYACSTHSLIYRSDGSSWSTWMTIGSTTTTVASDAIWDTKGDLAAATGADAASKLAVGTNGKALIAASGETTGLKWDWDSGHEFQYDAASGDVTISGTTEGGATTVIDATAFTADGAPVITSIYSPQVYCDTTSVTLQHALLDGATVVAGRLAHMRSATVGSSDHRLPLYAEIRWTPSAGSHTLHWVAYKSSGTWQVSGGTGGTGGLAPMFIRTVKV